MKETKLYVGMSSKSNLQQTLDDEKYISILKRVCRHYHVPFTFTVSSGGYIMETGEYVEEKSLVLSLIDLDDELIGEVAKDLCVFFNQESILITENEIRSYFVREELPEI